MAYDPNDPADKAIVDGLIAEATAGLTTKNKELLDEVKTARRNGPDPKVVERLEKDVERLETDLLAANTDRSKLTKDLEKATKSLETETTENRTLLVDNGLTAALTKNKVGEAYLDGALALHRGKVEIVVEDGKRVAKMDGKLLDEAVKAWTESDTGKHYVSAANNGGGGGPGSGSGQGSNTVTRTAFDAMSPQGRMDFAKGGGEVVAG